MDIGGLFRLFADPLLGRNRVKEMYQKDWDAIVAARNTPGAIAKRQAEEKAEARRKEEHEVRMQEIDALHAHMLALRDRNMGPR